MRLRLSDRARQDIGEIGQYVRKRSPRGALTVRDELQGAFQTLREHPHAGRQVGANLYRWPIPRVPFLVFYRIDEKASAILVVTIRHAARDEDVIPNEIE